ncbi:MAG: DAK2 domain-containing protein [Firmicutes bacterium]|nr:DAK2 domain-containing protein [Bacillota bacterium]
MQVIQAELFKQMLLMGAHNLERNRASVDALNVFPVPDGDTGTNMNLTLQAVVKAVSQVDEPHVGKLAAASATGSLMGARGNSGVILSQLFRGFGRHLQEMPEITALDLAQALVVGTETVYKAVRKPVEGTMLTVMREASQVAVQVAKRQNELLPTLRALVEQAESTLAKTPEMLPVLKQAGVVDAGGQGLLCVFKGWLAAASGEVIEDASVGPEADSARVTEPTFVSEEEIEFGYCTEFLILSPRVSEDKLHQELEPLGDSLLVVGDANLLKVHVHTNNPGRALEIGLAYGELSGIKIDNMREQHTELHFPTDAGPAEPVKPVGVIAVAVGDGLAEIFTSLGVDAIVTGGQTMNPSTEDLAKAANRVPAEQIIILPNNKNIVMAAEQVAEVVDKPIHVVPTRSIPQGLSALMAYNDEPADMAAMVANMTRNMRQVKSGQVTVAVRDHNGSAGMIKEGDFIGILEGDIVVFGDTLEQVTYELVAAMVDEEAGLLSLFFGEDVTEEVAQALADRMAEAFPDLELELRSGGQPIYHFIVAVE